MNYFWNTSNFSWLDPEIGDEAILTDNSPQLSFTSFKGRSEVQNIFDIYKLTKILSTDDLIELIGIKVNHKAEVMIEEQIAQLLEETKTIIQNMNGNLIW